MGRLNGKVAVITGATSGIGLRSAEIFVAEGAKVVVAGRRVAEGEALARRLGKDCVFRPTDVTVEQQMQTLIALAVDKFGRIDCLFNNAGGPAQTGGIEGLEVERFDLAMATLVRSVMLGMKHAAPYMKNQGFGSIINNGSIAGRLAGFSSSIVYSAAKAAVIHLTKCVAMELGESGIRVNSISPGAIATGIFAKALGLSVEAAESTPVVMREVYKRAQPIPRAGLPEDIAHAAVFLASDESSFINGHDLVVDGAVTGGRNWTQQQEGYVHLRKAFENKKGYFHGHNSGTMRRHRTRNVQLTGQPFDRTRTTQRITPALVPRETYRGVSESATSASCSRAMRNGEILREVPPQNIWPACRQKCRPRHICAPPNGTKATRWRARWASSGKRIGSNLSGSAQISGIRVNSGLTPTMVPAGMARPLKLKSRIARRHATSSASSPG